MPRNIAKPLSQSDARMQSRNTEILRPFVGTDEPVCLHYVKRNGEKSTSRGTVQFFNGQPGMDTGSVTIADPVKGNRTINLHNIIVID